MRLGTTPKHTFTFPFETSLIKELKIIYAQKNKTVLEKRLDDCEIETMSISCTLTQEETFSFEHGVIVEVQARVLTTDGDALASDICTITAERCLDNEVLE